MATMSKMDDEAAALYRVPLGEFTAARNALAKQLGPAAADVRTLAKPHAAAWAVNQLYWQRRATYDALINQPSPRPPSDRQSELHRRRQLRRLHGRWHDRSRP